MVTNVGRKTISIREELGDAPPEAAGWFAWARAATAGADVDVEAKKGKNEEEEFEAEKWKVVEPGKVIPFWPSARNVNLQLIARLLASFERGVFSFADVFIR